MAGSRFIDLVTDAEEITQTKSIRSTVKRLANDVLAQICGFTEWPYLWTTDFFQSIAPYETGTATVTDEDATVTFAGGASITAAMVGRKIRFGTETAYYTIKSRTSATEIELDQNYSGTTSATATFSIYKDEYLLRSDVDVQKRIREAENGVALFSLSATEFDDLYPIPTGEGTPGLDVFIGRATKTYSTGTVSASSGDRTLTGASTAWLTAEGVTKGTKIQIGSLLFTVNTVDSDTAIELYEVPTAAIGAGTAYVALLNNPVVQLHAIPDEVLTFYYRFQRIPAVMDADNDVPDLPYPMHSTLRLGMLPFFWRHRGNIDRAIESQQQFEKELNAWVAKYQLPVLDRRMPLHPFSIRRPTREARWEVGTGVPLYR